jgi:hypothetical protein
MAGRGGPGDGHALEDGGGPGAPRGARRLGDHAGGAGMGGRGPRGARPVSPCRPVTCAPAPRWALELGQGEELAGGYAPACRLRGPVRLTLSPSGPTRSSSGHGARGMGKSAHYAHGRPERYASSSHHGGPFRPGRNGGAGGRMPTGRATGAVRLGHGGARARRVDPRPFVLLGPVMPRGARAPLGQRRAQWRGAGEGMGIRARAWALGRGHGAWGMGIRARAWGMGHGALGRGH